MHPLQLLVVVFLVVALVVVGGVVVGAVVVACCVVVPGVPFSGMSTCWAPRQRQQAPQSKEPQRHNRICVCVANRQTPRWGAEAKAASTAE